MRSEDITKIFVAVGERKLEPWWAVYMTAIYDEMKHEDANLVIKFICDFVAKEYV